MNILEGGCEEGCLYSRLNVVSRSLVQVNGQIIFGKGFLFMCQKQLLSCRNFFIALLVLALSLTSVMAEAAQKIQLRAAANVPAADLMADSMKHFLDVLKNKSNGQITYDYFPGGVLGSIREVHESMKGYAIHMFAGTVGDLAPYDKLCDIGNFPYLYTSADEGNKVWEQIGPEFYDDLAKRSGWRVLYTWVGAPRDITAKKPIKTPEDMKGTKIRVPNWPIFITYFKDKLEASPTVVSFGELFSALKTGVVDAQENPVYRNIASGFYDVTPYNIQTHHAFDLNDVHVTEAFWQSLDAETQQLFRDAAKEARAWTLEQSEKKMASSIDEAKAKFGTKFVEPDVAAFQKAAVGLENDYPYLKDMVMKIRALK